MDEEKGTESSEDASTARDEALRSFITNSISKTLSAALRPPFIKMTDIDFSLKG